MRLFNEDLEIPFTIDNHLHDVYDLLSIGITTTKGRFDDCDSLYKSIIELYPGIPLHIIVNYHDGETIPKWKYAKVEVYDTLHGISFCKNQHNFFYPERPLVLVFDDDAFLTDKFAIDNLLYVMTNYEDLVMVRGFCNNCCDLISKKSLARVGWWDERFIFEDDDTDLHMRFERERVSLGLEHNKARFPDFKIVGHRHNSIINYKKPNGKEMLFKKWGLKQQPVNEYENINCKQLLPDNDLYPEYSEKFSKFSI